MTSFRNDECMPVCEDLENLSSCLVFLVPFLSFTWTFQKLSPRILRDSIRILYWLLALPLRSNQLFLTFVDI